MRRHSVWQIRIEVTLLIPLCAVVKLRLVDLVVSSLRFNRPAAVPRVAATAAAAADCCSSREAIALSKVFDTYND